MGKKYYHEIYNLQLHCGLVKDSLLVCICVIYSGFILLFSRGVWPHRPRNSTIFFFKSSNDQNAPETRGGRTTVVLHFVLLCYYQQSKIYPSAGLGSLRA